MLLLFEGKVVGKTPFQAALGAVDCPMAVPAVL